MKDKIDEARSNCAAAIRRFYKNFWLLADMLGDNGEYRSFWMFPDGTILEFETEDVFDEKTFTYGYQLEYVNPQHGWPIAG